MSLTLGGRDVRSLSVGHSADVDIQSGTSRLRVPVPVPPGRGGFGPALALSYASGAGNSPFGAGWTFEGLPTIQLDTRFHVPRWDGTDGYQLGGDELVTWLEQTPNGWTPRGSSTGDYAITFLRSRRGSAQVRVEKWLHVPSGRIHFRTRDARNVVTIYGARANAAARIGAPGDESRTFAWLPEVQADPAGNVVWFEYVGESSYGVDTSAPAERVHTPTAQRYIRRILYGNVGPMTVDAAASGTLPAGNHWCFQVVFDYGDNPDPSNSGALANPAWPARQDPFSTFRNGFEVRTYRLCRRILVFHDFRELGASPTLVGALQLAHDEAPAGSTLREITQIGYRYDGGAPASELLPPLRMTYAPPAPNSSFVEASATASENAPAGLLGRRLTFVDLRGEGLLGMLTENDRAWYYKPNLGGGEFGAQTLVLERPDTRPGAFAFSDIDHDGNTELVQLAGRFAGLYELDREDEAWRSFRPFLAFPHVEGLGGRAQWVDLNGDGRPDIVVSRDDALVWFASDGDNFRSPVEIPRPAGMPPLTADPALDFFFVDMTGDGLADLVRVENGRIAYWPSLGNGHFGEAVVMDGVPKFAPDGAFDASRLRFVDLDGTGTTDIVYLGDGEVRCWINAAGNSLVAWPPIAGLPYLDNASSVRVLDFLGDGRSCVVWSSPLPGRESPLEYLPLTPKVPPRLLLSVDNSLGQVTTFAYASSAEDYLRDVASGRGWTTRLPMHHTVVRSRELWDQIGNSRSVQRYAYHDGYYDGVEREQRGFGQVDVIDAEAIDGTAPGAGASASAPPSMVRTWFHLGTSMWGHLRPQHLYANDPQLLVLAPHVLEQCDQLTAEQIDDGLRALAGQVIRREVYAVDENDVPAADPFEVQQATLRLINRQPAQGHEKAAFSVTQVEAATWTYEQVPNDPRVVHNMVLATDDFDLPMREVTVGYPRRQGRALDVDAQGAFLIKLDDRGIVDTDVAQQFEIGIPGEEKGYELAGLRPGPTGLFTRDQFNAPAVSAAIGIAAASYADLRDEPAQGPAARLLSWRQSYYWDDSRSAALPVRQVGAITLLHHEEAACFDSTFVQNTFAGHVDPGSQLPGLGYATHDGLWWKVEPTHVYNDASQFCLPASLQRSDGATTALAYDGYWLHVTQATDPLGNSMRAAVDYYQLAPWQLTDANGTTNEVRYDPLGVVVTATTYGHVAAQSWGFDPLAAVAVRTQTSLTDALGSADQYLQGAARYLWYDLGAWTRDAVPTPVVTLTAEQLLYDGAGGSGAGGRIAEEVQYLDGFGRPLQKKTRVEASPAIQRDGQGAVVVDAGGHPVAAIANPCWRVSGHVVYNPKQQPSYEYEPFFSPTATYEGDDVLQHVGVSIQYEYDAIGRLVRQDYPDFTFATSTLGAWSVQRADPNDNVVGSLYAANRQGRPLDDPERQAYENAKRHANTQRITYVDPLGRDVGTFEQGASTGPDVAPDTTTKTLLDLEGRPKQVIDTRALVAFQYARDMLGRALYENGIDSGEVWTLPDAFDRAITTWNGRRFSMRRGYDLGDRPLFTHVTGGDGLAPIDLYAEQWAYGESIANRADAVAKNALGRPIATSDNAGSISVDQYDPAGRALSTTQRLRQVDATGQPGQPEPDWRVEVPDPTPYTATAAYDALGRPTRDVLVDGTARAYAYLPSGPLSNVSVTTPDGQLTQAAILAGTSYGARGERLGVSLGNGVQTGYGYDPFTYRLSTQTAAAGATALQGLRYTYDPVGNLICVTDSVQEAQTTMLAGAASARRDYWYDAHHRLYSASGRAHRALLQNDFVPSTAGGPGFMGTRRTSLNDGTQVKRFTQVYDYDAAGNMKSLKHVGAQSWTTAMWVSATSNRSMPSLDTNGNPVANPEGAFDAGGNLTQVAHMRQMTWSYRDSLARAVVVQRPGGTDDGERYFYGNDAQRVRKITTRVVNAGVIEVTETVYLGDCERKRITSGGVLVLERWRIHVGDGQDRVAQLYRWTTDANAREVDGVTANSPLVKVDYQLNTQQGSTALVLDEIGGVISYEEYFAYGGSAFVAGDDVRAVSRKDYRYSAKECDGFTGLYYYGYRYYAHWMVRWLTPDPAGDSDDLNLYQFVRGNPTSLTDPDGLQSSAPHPPEPDDYHGTIPGPFLDAMSRDPRFAAQRAQVEHHGPNQHFHIEARVDGNRLTITRVEPSAADVDTYGYVERPAPSDGGADRADIGHSSPAEGSTGDGQAASAITTTEHSPGHSSGAHDASGQHHATPHHSRSHHRSSSHRSSSDHHASNRQREAPPPPAAPPAQPPRPANANAPPPNASASASPNSTQAPTSGGSTNPDTNGDKDTGDPGPAGGGQSEASGGQEQGDTSNGSPDGSPDGVAGGHGAHSETHGGHGRNPQARDGTPDGNPQGNAPRGAADGTPDTHGHQERNERGTSQAPPGRSSANGQSQAGGAPGGIQDTPPGDAPGGTQNPTVFDRLSNLADYLNPLRWFTHPEGGESGGVVGGVFGLLGIRGPIAQIIGIILAVYSFVNLVRAVTSAVGAAVRTGARMAAAGAAQLERNASRLVQVSRWGRSGLEPGDWVMRGGRTRWNYFWSGKWQPGLGNQFAPFSSGESFVVPEGSLRWPSGWGPDGWIKGLFGQRLFAPPALPPATPMLPPTLGL